MIHIRETIQTFYGGADSQLVFLGLVEQCFVFIDLVLHEILELITNSLDTLRRGGEVGDNRLADELARLLSSKEQVNQLVNNVLRREYSWVLEEDRQDIGLVVQFRLSLP